MVERHDSDLALSCTVCHVRDLGVNGSLDALDTRYICYVAVISIHELVRAVSELAHLIRHLL